MQPRTLFPSFKKCSNGDLFKSFNEEDIGSNKAVSFDDPEYEESSSSSDEELDIEKFQPFTLEDDNEL